METIPRTCPLCGASQPKIRLRLDDRLHRTTQHEFPVADCEGCGITYLPEIPADLSAIYPTHYWRNPLEREPGFSGVVRSLEELWRSWALRGHRRYLRSLPPGGPLIEIGGGAGDFAMLAQRHGHPVWLIEADPRAAAIARQRGVSRVSNAPGETGWPEEWEYRQAAGVVGFHVLEHMADPARMLREVSRRLKPGSRAIFQVPNYGSIQARLLGHRWNALDVPRHLTHFTPATLTRMLRESGLEPVRWYFYSRRDSGPCVISSITTGTRKRLIDFKRATASLKNTGIRFRLIRGLAFWAAVVAVIPLCWIEAAVRRGGIMTVVAEVKGPPQGVK